MMSHRCFRLTHPPLATYGTVAAMMLAACNVATAQQPQPAAPAPSQAPAPQQQFQPSGEWQKLPRMELQRQFAGPLQDTVVQRWRDPTDGTVCYIYLPITAPHSATTASGFVQYGPTTIGSISCLPVQSEHSPPTGRPPTPRKP